jgi:hypothetical protein
MVRMTKSLLPLGITSAAITAILFGAVATSGPRGTAHPAHLIFLLFLFVTIVLFSAVGLLLLQPIVWLIRKWRISQSLALATLTVAGADVGWLLLSWVPKDAWIGGGAGAATAAVWFTFNRDSLRSHTEA